MICRRPIYGLISFAIPFLAILFLIAGIALTAASAGFRNLENLIFPIAMILWVAGVVIGVVGIFKHERKRWLSIEGIVLNAGFVIAPILMGAYPAGIETTSVMQAIGLLFDGDHYESPKKNRDND